MKEKQGRSTIRMKYINSLICKFKISAWRLRNRICAIITDFFAAVGIIVMIGEAASNIFSYQGFFDFYRIYAWWILVVLVVGCVGKNWDYLNYTVKIKGSPDVIVSLKVCDALQNEGAIIIPTNSTFDTEMNDEFISKASIQGQYQTKYFNEKTAELDKRIKDGLIGKAYVELKDGRKYNTKRYPIGTVSRVNVKNKRAYFLVDSDIDSKGIPIDVDAETVSQALTSLWNNIHREGNNEPYSIPLIGTGKARAKDISRNEAVQQIILSFLAASKEHKITECLTICIYPLDFNKIDWDGLCEFLKYQSQYANVRPSEMEPTGIAEAIPSEIGYIGNDDFVENEYNCVQTDFYKAERVLSKREKVVVELLNGNRMRLIEIAKATGLSVVGTNLILQRLVDEGVVFSEKIHGKREYFVPNIDGDNP